jgi:hypothetical protein
MIAPQPAHHFGKYGLQHLLAVAVDTPRVINVVALLREGLLQPDILIEPVASLIVVTVAPQPRLSFLPSTRKTRIGFFSLFRMMSG